jgi:hypothetical protein
MNEGIPTPPKKPDLKAHINELFSIADQCMSIEGVKMAGENNIQFISRMETLKAGLVLKDPNSIAQLESIRSKVGNELFNNLVNHLR